jgi:hypothetical protein
LEQKSDPNDSQHKLRMRVHDPVGGPPDLDRYVRDYETYFSKVDHFSHHLRRLIAGYSRGEDLNELRTFFSFVIQKVDESEHSLQAKYGGDDHLFKHQGKWGERFRDALVLLTVGLCLRATREEIANVLSLCDRGDPLIETLAAAAAPGMEMPTADPAFPTIYDGLYAALRTSGTEREQCIRNYLAVWYQEKMEGFGFKDDHLLKDQADYVGYWCFEAAGIVAALNIDDSSFSDHPHYPRDLVAFYRS